MNSKELNFKIKERGFKEYIVLIPGFATDYRIFNDLNIPYNYILPIDTEICHCEQSVAISSAIKALSKRCEKRRGNLNNITLLGWSMGGYTALEIYERNKKTIKKLILIGMREYYNKRGIEKIKTYVIRNKDVYLKNLYKDCFGDNEKDLYLKFKKELELKYFNKFKTDELLRCLDYIASKKLDIKLCDNKKVTFIHGTHDKIAPLKLIEPFYNKLTKAEARIIANAGHLAFFRE